MTVSAALPSRGEHVLIVASAVIARQRAGETGESCIRLADRIDQSGSMIITMMSACRRRWDAWASTVVGC